MTPGTDRDVHSAVVRWLAGLTGLTVIKAHQSGQRPALPYLMVNLTGITEVRENAADDNYIPPRTLASSTYVLASEDDLNASLLLDDAAIGDIEARPLIETEWQFSIHAYGPQPNDILRPVRAATQLPQMNEPLMPGVHIHDLSQIRVVPDWINNRWEPRSQMDLFARGMTADGFVVDTIDHYSFDIERD